MKREICESVSAFDYAINWKYVLDNLSEGDKLTFFDFENMNAFIQKLNYKGIVYRQILPLVIVIDYVPKEENENV